MVYSCSPLRLARVGLSGLGSAVTRKKSLGDGSSPLARVLSLFDLTLLGVGTTLGLGVYVLAGKVARDQAGPAVVVSFAIAAVASLLAGLCYAEFASRVPKAGSVYVYAYVTIGELVAFVIGWDLILEYAIGTASVSRGVAGYVDSLAGNVIANYFNSTLPIRVPHMAEYPDFFAFTIIMALSVMLAIGVKESSHLNSLLTVLNLTTVVIVVGVGSFYASPSNWNLALEDIPSNVTDVGTGGFAPFGFKGIVSGAATSFFGYVGFDIIATTSEEAKNPRRNIPLAILMSLLVVFLTYFSMATVLTMMVPYYAVDKNAPYPAAFEKIGMTTIKWIVTIGGVFALNTSLIGGMFPLPRIMYAMSRDGLLFEFLGRVNGRTKTPVVATIISGLLSGVMVLAFELSQLVDMMSIGTLLAYTLVALCVLILRFAQSDTDTPSPPPGEHKAAQLPRLLVNGGESRRPTRASETISISLILAFFLVSLAMCGVMSWRSEGFYGGAAPEVISAAVLGAALVGILIFLSLQPKSSAEQLSFSVPMVPVVPCVSILLNIYLMTELDKETWVRFIVWLVLGAVVYFSYSMHHSVERSQNKVATVPTEMLAVPETASTKRV